MNHYTIFIHGTLPPTTLLTLPYAHELLYVPAGMTNLQDLPDWSNTYQFLTALCSADSVQFPQKYCYAYGWSGSLSFEERHEAAATFLKTVKTLVQPNNSITLITHSHGGNLALNCADILKNDDHFSIDRLILLACPAQKATRDFVKAPCFKHITSFHSHLDILQVLDPQGLADLKEHMAEFGVAQTLTYLKTMTPLFSERHFPTAPHVVQPHVTKSSRELFHVEFILPSFAAALPTLLQAVYTNKDISLDSYSLIIKSLCE